VCVHRPSIIPIDLLQRQECLGGYIGIDEVFVLDGVENLRGYLIRGVSPDGAPSSSHDVEPGQNYKHCDDQEEHNSLVRVHLTLSRINNHASRSP